MPQHQYNLQGEQGDYLEEKEIFQKEKEVLVRGELVRFMNMLDKGYQARAAHETHNQLIAQHVIGKSDEQFKGQYMLYMHQIEEVTNECSTTMISNQERIFWGLI